MTDFVILKTDHLEIHDALNGAGRSDLAQEVLYGDVPNSVFEYIASRLADILMEGGDYWEGLAMVAINELDTWKLENEDDN